MFSQLAYTSLARLHKTSLARLHNQFRRVYLSWLNWLAGPG